MVNFRLSAAAQTDIFDILAWSQAQFGDTARLRYEVLIATALRDIAAEPERPGSIERPELGTAVRSWHLRLSHERARTDIGVVRHPRHFLIYRTEPCLVVIARVLHDVMEMTRHINPETAWE